jgi:hypothetical protein
MNRPIAPFAFVILWIISAGLLLWAAALSAVEPPVWDAMSYVKKGMTFWQMMASGQWVNPFNLEPTMRPPGTVLMAYPLGFDSDFRGFYFRSSFIPLLLLGCAGLIANPRPSFSWTAAALTIVLISMPMLYQFQANDLVLWDVNWGMVDNFMAGAAAVSAASVLRSIQQRSVFWAVIAALTAALCFLIKPSGIIVIGLTGLAWFVLVVWHHRARIDALWKDTHTIKYVLPGLTLAMLVFGAAVYYGFASDYFSISNILFGNRVIAILSNEISVGVGFGDFFDLIRISIGLVIAILTVVGLILSFRSKQYSSGFVSAVCLIIGLWFWLLQTEPWEPRYFVPFGMMAFVFLVPTLIDTVNHMTWAQKRLAGGIAILPGLITLLLLYIPTPPTSAQRALGVNLITQLFKDETTQAQNLIQSLRDTNVKHSSVYRFNISPAQRSFEATLSYTSLIDPTAPIVDILSPMDWQRTSTFRLEEMARAQFLLFEPVLDAQYRQTLLERRDVPDFYTETILFSAWATTLNTVHGVQQISQTSVRLLKIVDAKAFETAFAEFITQHNWRPAFLQNNQSRWWSLNELQAHLDQSGAALLNAAYTPSTPNGPSLTVRGATSGFKGTMFDVDIWVEGNAPQTWVLFAHIINQNGEILRNAQANTANAEIQNSDHPIRRYTLTYPDIPPEATSLAVGFFLPKDNDIEFLLTTFEHVDWDGRRLILPLNKGESAN